MYPSSVLTIPRAHRFRKALPLRRRVRYNGTGEPSKHFREMLRERGIATEWVSRALEKPDRAEDREDGTRHYLRQIEEFGNRWLRVIVDNRVVPPKGITAFFDRRLREERQ